MDGATDAGGTVDSGPTGDDRPFEPDIPNTYDGAIIDPGLELLAFTIHEDSLGTPQYLAALRNISTDLRLCALDMTTTFFDAGGSIIGDARGLVETPLARGVSGTGSLAQCLMPGQIGMQAALLDIGSASISEIASATWEVGAINLIDSVVTSDLQVVGLMAVPGPFGGTVFSGQLRNDGSTTVRAPSVRVFGVNSVGRPLFEGFAIDSGSLSPGGTWAFDTNPSFDEPYTDAVAFPDGND